MYHSTEKNVFVDFQTVDYESLYFASLTGLSHYNALIIEYMHHKVNPKNHQIACHIF